MLVNTYKVKALTLKSTQKEQLQTANKARPTTEYGLKTQGVIHFITDIKSLRHTP
jgi:hypothetical protein